jgi:bacterioferritin
MFGPCRYLYMEVGMHEQIIEMLREDMKGEHQAIIQYLAHAYGMGEGVISFEVEAIARDEMRHLDWLADLIGELGGKPTTERAAVDFTSGTPQEQLLKDVATEEHGIAQYRAHLEAIEDANVRLTISRILNDELAHHAKFIKLAEEAAAEPAPQAAAAPAPEPSKRLTEILNEGVRHEYTVILQYLFHGFAAQSKDLAEQMQNIAINEMQHMGWLAEELVGQGGSPNMSHTELALSADPEEMLEADIAAERAVTQVYTKQLSEIDDPKVGELVAHIRDQEIFHDAQFGYLLGEVEAAEHTVPPALECPAPEPPAAPAPPSPPVIPSVGSLIESE